MSVSAGRRVAQRKLDRLTQAGRQEGPGSLRRQLQGAGRKLSWLRRSSREQAGTDLSIGLTEQDSGPYCLSDCLAVMDRRNVETGPLLDGKGRRVRFHGRVCPFPPVLLGSRCLRRGRSPQRRPRRFRRAPGRISCGRFSCGRVFCSRHSSGRSCPSGGHSGRSVSSGWHCQPVGEEAPRGEAGPGEGEPEGSARPHPGRGSLPRRLRRQLRRRPERQFWPMRPA